MSFDSYGFIFIFLPLTITIYYLLTSRERYEESNIFLLIASIGFYLYYDWKCFLILVVMAVGNYYCSKNMLVLTGDVREDNGDVKKSNNRLLLGISISINVIVLCFFKYYGFFIESLGDIFKKDNIFTNIIMPLGISFFVFQQIAYLVDSYRGDGVVEHTLQEHLLFSFFFPCITSGPITYFSEMIPQFRNHKAKRIDYDNLCKGLYLFSLGLAKKVLLAQPFAVGVSDGYTRLVEYGFVNSFLMMICYSLQIYFDFSGYSDMAIGVAKMLNIDLPINFNSPYQAYDISDFWNRWHITLTRFLTKYIYIPLGGNRKGKIRTYVNIMIVFIISGLWHGAALTFVIWGVLHGIMSVIYRLGKKVYDKWHPAFKWFVNFMAVSVAWIYFGAPGKAEANTIVSKLIKPQFENINLFFADEFNTTEADFIFETLTGSKLPDVHPNIMLGVFLLFSFFIILCTENNMRIVKEGFVYRWRHAMLTVVLIVASLLALSRVSTFIYAMF